MVDRQTAMAVNLQTIRHTTAGEHRRIRGRNCPFLLSAVRQCPHITLPLPPGPRKSYSNPRIPGGICSIHESEIPGRRAKGTFERICGIRSRHPMSHCPCRYVVPLRQPALLFLPFRDHVPNATRVKDRPTQTGVRLSAPLSTVLSNFASRNRLRPVPSHFANRGSIVRMGIGPRNDESTSVKLRIAISRSSVLRMSPFTSFRREIVLERRWIHDGRTDGRTDGR